MQAKEPTFEINMKKKKQNITERNKKNNKQTNKHAERNKRNKINKKKK
jgi:hypothetical protein